MFKFVIVTLIALLSGCSGTFQQQVQTALVFEGVAQTTQAQIYGVASAAIQLLPADQQAAATVKLNAANQVLVDALAAKDDALQQAANAGSFANIDFAQITSAIVKAIQDIIVLANDFGVSPAKTAPMWARMNQAKALVK